MVEALLTARDVGRTFGGGRSLFGAERLSVQALKDVTLEIRKGETLGVVGESGCGKSTLARILVGLDLPTEGQITFGGRDLSELARVDRAGLSRMVQYVFQDPIASLNPRKTIRQTLEAPLIHLLRMRAAVRSDRVIELMELVNLSPDFLDRYPHEFSGGQAQRIAIARALAADPDLIILDEPVSALDVSVQAQVLNLLDDLKSRLGLTYLFISHDLSVVESVSDRVAVLYFGRLAEQGDVRAVFNRSRHPYTRLLLRSVPVPGKRSLIPEDANTELPDPYNPPTGCAFAARCPRVTDECRAAPPSLAPDQRDPTHLAACLHPHGSDDP